MSQLTPVYEKFMEVINDIDIKLDSLDDTAGASKRAITKELIETFEDDWKAPAEGMVAQLEGFDNADRLIGVYKGLISFVQNALDKKVAELVDAKVEHQPKSEPLITPEQAADLAKERSEIYQNVKQVVHLAKVAEGIDLEMPKMRRGSKGKRGPRAMSLMVWSIDGTELDPQPETLKAFVTDSLGFGKTSEFYAFLKSKEIDATTPEGGEVNFELPDGRTVYGYIPTEEDEEEEAEAEES